MITFTVINAIILAANIYFAKTKFPKWEYYKEGIRFFNKKGEATIEYDKPLRK
jgi:hypothetical protein